MNKVHEFHKTKQGYLVFGLVELIAVYFVGSVALDTANMFIYALTVILFIGAVVNLVNAMRLQLKK